MKIATFNIWNSDRGMPLREQQIINELKALSSDIICLQEVKEEIYNKLTSEISEYKYSYYHHDIECDGLVVFSKYPILTKTHTKYAILTTCEYANSIYLVVNVHLPSDSIMQQEQHIVEIIKEIESIDADFAILTGDFNCSENSSVHHYLTGERTLLNSAANSPWYDVAEVNADITNTKLENTLDIRNNPRWKGKKFTYTSSRLDRIYVRDTFPKAPPQLRYFSLFGKNIDEQSGYCASDHYGVIAEVDFDSV